MKRIQRVEQLLHQWTTEQFDSEQVQTRRPQGCTAEWTGETLHIERSNASRDLNALVDQQKAIKIGGKPVLFLSFDALCDKWGNAAQTLLRQTFSSWAHFAEMVGSLTRNLDKAIRKQQQTMSETSAFDVLQGKNRSLKKAIELAKAAIFYPPDGLHTLLTGPTGVGKTLFAEHMYRFAVQTGQLRPDAPFVAFNCADYSNNPQLLLGHLFGVVRGAYTGAEQDRRGLVEKADGGVLFLDEVHRLPPEGQEMLFQLLDRGMFRRLGESDVHRTARVRLIAATTEHVESNLLLTFVRRIPMSIPIPALSERSLEERFALIRFLFSQESVRVQRSIWIAPDVMKALLLFDCPANVGQLKSEIQLLTARSFLAQMQEQSANMLKITLTHASDHVREGVLKIVDLGHELHELWEQASKGLVINGEDTEPLGPHDQQRESLYEVLERQAFELRERGLSEEEINQLLSVDIDLYFRKFLQRVSRQFASRRQEIAQLVGESLLELVEGMFDIASARLERVFSSQTAFGTALHLRAALDRLQTGVQIPNPGLGKIRAQSPEEYRTAREMAERFEERTGLLLPEDEVGYLATILTSTLEADPVPKVGILVVAHGRSTATSMLETAQQLLGTTHGKALDLSFHADRDEIFEQVVEDAQRLDEGRGVLLLVDMGELLGWGEAIQTRTGIAVKSVSQVTTLMVMEAVRKAALSPSTLEAVYALVKQVSHTALNGAGTAPVERKGVIPVVCVTGAGSAVQLKAILEERLVVPDDFELSIVPVSIASFEETPERLEKWLGGAKPLAIVGTLNPNVEGVPFISAQDLLIGNGLQQISQLLGATMAAKQVSLQSQSGDEPPSVWDSLMNTFRQSVKRVNPYYVVPLLLQALEEMETRLGRTFDLEIRIGVTMHLVMAVEHRLLHGMWPTEQRVHVIEEEFASLGNAGKLKDALHEVMQVLAKVGAEMEIEIPASEGKHILHLLLQESQVR